MLASFVFLEYWAQRYLHIFSLIGLQNGLDIFLLKILGKNMLANFSMKILG